MANEKKQKRIVVYLPEDDYKELRAKLILMGTTVSEWFRKVMKDFIQK